MNNRFLLLFLGISAALNGQSILGSWEVIAVQAGPHSMTPQAKWVTFETEGFFGGNGYLQNSAGIYHWDQKAQTIRLEDSLGFPDPNPAFQISFKGDTMLWQRLEEGMELTVQLRPMEEKPLRPADHIIGVWAPEDSESLAFIRFGWTQTYELRYKDGRSSRGVWRCHPHRPEVVLIPWDEEEKNQLFLLEYQNWKDLTLKAKDSNLVWSLARLRDYPD